MDDVQQKIKDNFAENLKADEYIKQMTSVWIELPETFKFMMMFINDVFRSERFKGSKLLEIGSAATVHSIAAASAYFSNITMSDYVQDNVDNLKMWIEGRSDLKQFLDMQVGLEGYGNDLETGKKILESRIRERVKRVTRCDVLADKILLDDNSNDPLTSPPFDMIISCLTLEAAPKDFSSYFSSLEKINNLLRTGGGLLMCGFFKCDVWNVGEKLFNHVYLDKEKLGTALTKAGFQKIDMKSKKEMAPNNIVFELFCVAAEKKMNLGLIFS